jgi:general nucleoside transport system permease protein
VHDSLFVLVLATAVGTATPLLLAALGETVIERAGVLNLGVEGMMLIAALTAFWASTNSGNPWYGIMAATLVIAIVGALYAVVTVSLGCDQVVAGLALNVLAFGLTSYLGRKLVGVAPSEILKPVPLPLLGGLPILGTIFFRQPSMAYVSYLFVPLLTLFLFGTRWGLNLRAVGESPSTADGAGISVTGYRYFATITGAAIIGLAGAHLSTSIAPAWTDNLTAGRGWIALALVIFGGWSPVGVLFGALLFGIVEALAYHAQALNLPISSYFLQAMPYVFTVVVLGLGAHYSRRRRLGAPAALGLFWRRT